MVGASMLRDSTSIFPGHVTRVGGPELNPTIQQLPAALDDLIRYRWPDALWVATERHSGRCIIVWILDLDYSYTEWVAHLSLDDRWTVSPVRGPWHTAETGVSGPKGGKQWRKRARKLKRK